MKKIILIVMLFSGLAHGQNKVVVMVTTNGILLTPTNLFGGNTGRLAEAMAPFLSGGVQTTNLTNVTISYNVGGTNPPLRVVDVNGNTLMMIWTNGVVTFGTNVNGQLSISNNNGITTLSPSNASVANLTGTTLGWGIGTNAPTAKLHVSGGVRVEGGQTNTGTMSASAFSVSGGNSQFGANATISGVTHFGYNGSSSASIGSSANGVFNLGNVNGDNVAIVNLSNVVARGSLTATNGVAVPTNAAPSNVTLGVTTPDIWFQMKDLQGRLFYVPAFTNH